MIGKTVLVTLVLVGGLAQAQEQEVDLDYADLFEPRLWTLAPEVYYFNYEEPGVMEDEGWFYGLIASYTHRPSSGRTFKVEGRFDWGEVDYDGALGDGTPYEMKDIEDYVLGIGLLWGREWDPARFIDGFHMGIAYRYLNDDSSFDPAGYEREANYLYLPLRLTATAGSQNVWQVGFMAELDVLLFGLQISHLGDVIPGAENIQNVQLPFSGVGAQGAVAIRHRGEYFDISFGPFIRYWWIAESQEDEELGIDWVEPENNTLEYGVNVTFQF